MKSIYSPKFKTQPTKKIESTKFQRSRKFLLSQLIISLIGAPLSITVSHAQTSCTGSSANCYDLYQGTLNAMQQAGVQLSEFTSMSATANGAGFYPTAFTGGTLVSGTMTYDLSSTPPNSSNTALTSWTAIACPSSGGAVGSYELEYTVSNELELTSDTSVENTSSTAMNGSAEVGIEYKSPSTTGGADPSASFSFEYGVEYESSSSTGYGTANSSGTESTLSQVVEYDIPEGYAQTFTLTSTVSTYSSIPWSAPVALTGTLGSLTYSQQWKNTINPPASTQQVNYKGTMVNANVWIPPVVWEASSTVPMQPLASPSGAYAFFPTPNAALLGDYLKSPGSMEQTYWEGEWYGTSGQGMKLKLDSSCTGNCAGSFWASNYDGSTVAWDSNTSPQYLAMQDDGNLVGYSPSWEVVWTSNTSKGINPAPILNATPVPAVSTVLPPSGQAFIATGTYASTTYTSNAWVQYGPQVALTQEQLNQCSATTASNKVITQPNSLAASLEKYADYAIASESTESSGVLLAQNNRPNDDPRLKYEERRSNIRQDVEQRPDSNLIQQQQSQPIQNKLPIDARKADNRRTSKLEKLKSPLVLSPEQYFATTLPGFKVVKLSNRSNNLTNKLLTIPGPSSLENTPKPVKVKKFKWKPRYHTKFGVKSK